MAAPTCNGWCLGLKKPRPSRMPFLTHTHCRECEWWIPKEDWSQARCKCCNNILATKPRLNQNKRKYAVALRQ